MLVAVNVQPNNRHLVNLSRVGNLVSNGSSSKPSKHSTTAPHQRHEFLAFVPVSGSRRLPPTAPAPSTAYYSTEHVMPACCSAQNGGGILLGKHFLHHHRKEHCLEILELWCVDGRREREKAEERNKRTLTIPAIQPWVGKQQTTESCTFGSTV